MNSNELYKMACDAYLNQRYDEAEKIYKRIISEFPDSEDAKASKEHLSYFEHKEAKENEEEIGNTFNKEIIQKVPLNSVIITDITIPFSSMVVFMVKWVFASIPAMIIFSVVAALVMAVMSLLCGSLWGFHGLYREFRLPF